MRSRYRVSFSGVQMDSLDSNLLILDVQYPSASFDEERYEVAGMDGYKSGEKRLRKQTVVVTFELHIYDIAKRQEALQKVLSWASGQGTLTINDRSGTFMTAQLENYPSITSVRDWTKPLTLSFTSIAIPYWRNNTETQRTLNGKSANGKMNIPGNGGDTIISVEVTATEAIKTLKLVAGDTTLSLSGLSVKKNDKVIVDYVSNRFLRIRMQSGTKYTSILNKLDSSSSDRLILPCGKESTVSVTASAKVSALFKGRGLWL